MALIQGDQALGAEERVGPASMIAATASALASVTLAQDASQPSTRVTVDCFEDIALAVLEIFNPAFQNSVELLAERFYALAACASCLGLQNLQP